MSRSFITMRRVLFGVSCAVVFGFGATDAFAERAGRSATPCAYGDPVDDAMCNMECSRPGYSGWCGVTGYCKCSITPMGHEVPPTG